MTSRLLLCCVGAALWLAVTSSIFQIAHTRQRENDFFNQYGCRADGTITDEFTQGSLLPIGRGLRYKACFIVCSYSPKEGGIRQSVAEVGPKFFESFPIGGIVPIYYLDQKPNTIRVMIPEVSEYHDLYAFDMFTLGLLNLIIGAGFFAVIIGRIAGLTSNASVRNMSAGTLIPSLFLILLLMALRQGW